MLMSFPWIQSRILDAAEMGRLPDEWVRAGIRHLLRGRSLSLRTSGDEETARLLREFIETRRTEPIAIVPEMANAQHYEVPPAFFQAVLGPRLKYSCCEWSRDGDSLAEAEEAALDITCQRAGIEDGQSILDLGCGWGSLSLWMAERFPSSRILGVSNSGPQGAFIAAQASERGLANLRVTKADINDFVPEQPFDRVVSVEMFEHVRNHQRLMRRISDWLTPAGKLFVHVFCHKSQPYLFDDKGPQDWMAREFFSGGIMPSETYLPQFQCDLSLVQQWRWNGRHYARTCRAWLNNLDQSRESALQALGGAADRNRAVRALGRWRLFFMACEELFAFNGGTEWFVSHSLFEQWPSHTKTREQPRDALHA